MNLKEYQGKQLFKQYNIAVPRGYVVRSVQDLNKIKDSLPNNLVLKSQILAGSRAKSGGIIFSNKNNIAQDLKKILNKRIKDLEVKEVLIEEKIHIQNEFYLAFTINRTHQSIMAIFSSKGGVDIEELPKTSPNKVTKERINLSFDLEQAERLPKKFNQIDHQLIFNLYKLMRDYDCELVEINPLVIDNNGRLIAADSKIIIDDNSLFRHQEFKQNSTKDLIPAEKIASTYGLHYVDLDGNIAIIGNGAGLVMATLDLVEHFGGQAANFLDIGGGASVEKMEKSIEIVLLKQPKGIFINIFGGITRCDQVAQGIINYKNKHKIKIPMVIRMIGTNQLEAKKILTKARILSLDSMEECAKKIIGLVKNSCCTNSAYPDNNP